MSQDSRINMKGLPLLAVKQIAKLDSDRPHFSFFYQLNPFLRDFLYIFRPLDFFFDTDYKIVASMSHIVFVLCYSDVEFFYTKTFLYACMTSTIPSFLLFT